MDNDALWIWRRIGDFERKGIDERKPCELLAGMSDTMRADVSRVLPKIVSWLRELEERCREQPELRPREEPTHRS